jgi:hypothetical protein
MNRRVSLSQMIEANTERFFLRFLVSKRVKVEDQTAGTHYFLGYLFNLIMLTDHAARIILLQI